MDWLVLTLSGGGVLVAALAFVVWRLVREYGKKKVLEVDNARKDEVLDKVKEANKIASEVDRMPDGAAIDELLSKWSKR